jgi:hypothetical protein
LLRRARLAVCLLRKKPLYNLTRLSPAFFQGSAGKSVELHLRSGEKMGGKIAHVTDNVVHLSNLTGAEYFDAFVDVKDISAVVVRVAGR